MKIALMHDHFDEAHLIEVASEMRDMGAPSIKAVWMECYGHWAALEGCHRIRAAKMLGVTPNIEEVEYSDAGLEEDLGLDAHDGVTVADIADGSYNAAVIDF